MSTLLLAPFLINRLHHVQLVVTPLEFDDDDGAFFVNRQKVDAILHVFRRADLFADQKQFLPDFIEECLWAVANVSL